MPNYRRARVDGGTYFFTVNSFRRQPFLADADVRAALRAGIAMVRAAHPFVIEAWVLLHDHMHALWTLPPDDHDFSTPCATDGKPLFFLNDGPGATDDNSIKGETANRRNGTRQRQELSAEPPGRCCSGHGFW